MKRIITILIGVIILSNGVWSYFYFYNQDEPEYNTGAQVYILNGSGERWDVEGSNLNDVGSITGSYSYDELNRNKQTYESTTMTIAWKDNKGKIHSETIDLEIHSDISVIDYE